MAGRYGSTSNPSMLVFKLEMSRWTFSCATCSGRGRVPACETRIRSVLRRIGLSYYCGCRINRGCRTKSVAEIKHMSSRTQAAEAYIKALRTGEPSATQSASQYLADDVVL